MDTWSHEPFGNDDAADWACELEEAKDLSPVEAALDAVLENDGYVEAPEATCAVAAVEVIAKVLGRGTQSDAYTESVDRLGETAPRHAFACAAHQDTARARSHSRRGIGAQGALARRRRRRMGSIAGSAQDRRRYPLSGFRFAHHVTRPERLQRCRRDARHAGKPRAATTGQRNA